MPARVKGENMLKVSHLEAFNFEGAIRGMRQPFKTTDKNDSWFGIAAERDFCYIIDDFIDSLELINPDKCSEEDYDEVDSITEKYYDACRFGLSAVSYDLIGPKDLTLAEKLIRAGSPHDKFLRQIFVSMDIEAPLYFWKEMDTYKVGTVSDSESTMHTIMKDKFTKEMFANDDSYYCDTFFGNVSFLEDQIEILNFLREEYLTETDAETKNLLWRTLIQKLPSSYMQKRTWTGNYRVLRSIIEQRKNHKLIEWQQFIAQLSLLPYSSDFLF